MGKTCVICGKAGWSYYPFCREHLQMKADGKITKCEKCGTWHLSADTCPSCKNSVISKPTDSIEHGKENSELTCIICGEPSNGKHFCRSCYSKYRNRSVDIRITNCNETQILDEYGNLIYTCDDGRKVRSRAEAIICSWLYNNKIRIKYEEPVYYRDEESGETKTLHPDFYLPDYELYIEYNELSNPKYIKSKEYTQKIYDKLGLKVLIMTDKDLQDVAACLKPRLFIC